MAKERGAICTQSRAWPQQAQAEDQSPAPAQTGGAPTTRRTVVSRRAFLKVGSVATAALAAGGIILPPLLGSTGSSARADEIGPLSDRARANASFQLRGDLARAQHDLPLVAHPCNGDEALYADKSNSFHKCLPHDGFGRVDVHAYQSLLNALSSGDPADFEHIILGGIRHLTNPQAGLAFDLEGTDSHNFTVPPAPALASAQQAAEMVELYWASLLRDVPFTRYSTHALAQAAPAELHGLPGYAGPRNPGGQVTTQELFRGGFAGETVGPYLSQFMVLPTLFGTQPISQQFVTVMPGVDYLTDFAAYLTVQNGGSTGLALVYDPIPRCLRNGRDLSAWTHVDVLYQGYFVALLVLLGLGAPVNPGSPYAASRTQDGFGTFGGSDFAATVGEVAARALQRVWFQKWFVHRRARPEVPGAIAHLIQIGQGHHIDGTLSTDLLNSQGLARSFTTYGSYLLSQAFPEGAPTHPSYPTGHGTVAGACITVLKFFFDGSFVIPHPMVPSEDGLTLQPYVGAPLTVNGELHKLGHNVSFGHGIHAGIHYRSDTDESLKLGEAMALSILQEKAQAYNEPFTVHPTTFDGTIATIANE